MSEMNQLGVVGALRLPAPVERVLRRVPPLAWVFVAAASISLVGRIVGAPQGDGLALIGFVGLPIFTTDLLILLPAVVLVRRPTVRSDAPWIFWALVLIAIGTLVQNPASSIAERLGPMDVNGSWSLLGATLVSAPWVIVAAGWLCLAAGFLPLKSQRVRTGVSILAGLAVMPMVAMVVVDVPMTLEFLNGAWPDSAIALPGFAALFLTTLGKGALVWTFIRASGAPSRVEVAGAPNGAAGTTIDVAGAMPRPAVLAAALWAILTVVEAGAQIASSSYTPTEALAPLYSGAWVTLYVLTPTVLVGAFALGLVNLVVEREPRSTEA